MFLEFSPMTDPTLLMCHSTGSWGRMPPVPGRSTSTALPLTVICVVSEVVWPMTSSSALVVPLKLVKPAALSSSILLLKVQVAVVLSRVHVPTSVTWPL